MKRLELAEQVNIPAPDQVPAFQYILPESVTLSVAVIVPAVRYIPPSNTGFPVAMLIVPEFRIIVSFCPGIPDGDQLPGKLNTWETAPVQVYFCCEKAGSAWINDRQRNRKIYVEKFIPGKPGNFIVPFLIEKPFPVLMVILLISYIGVIEYILYVLLNTYIDKSIILFSDYKYSL